MNEKRQFKWGSSARRWRAILQSEHQNNVAMSESRFHDKLSAPYKVKACMSRKRAEAKG